MSGERRPGRPRKWASDGERMRAYRAARRECEARLVDPVDAPEVAVENAKLRARVAQLEDERDRMWSQIVRLQAQIRELERNGRTPEPSPPWGERQLSRAERRRAEREAARNQRREGR